MKKRVIFVLSLLVAVSLFSACKIDPCKEGHTYGEWVLVRYPGCLEAGLKQRTCEVCEKVDEAYIEPTGHLFNAWFVGNQATCEETGTLYRYCQHCNQEEKQTIPALGHSFGDATVTVPPSCKETGLETQVCTVCGKVKEEPIPALGHREVVLPATVSCLKDGLSEGRICAVCGKVLKEQKTVKATGHLYEDGKCVYCHENSRFTMNAIGYWLTAHGDGLELYRVDPNSKTNDLVIPGSLHGLPVVTIRSCAFQDDVYLKSIVIPDTVTEIQNDAFYGCENLKTIKIPTTITVLEGQLFRKCTSLESIDIPVEITIFKSAVFRECLELKTIRYGGTMEQWRNIDKGFEWDKTTGEFVVICTDGTLTKAEAEK